MRLFVALQLEDRVKDALIQFIDSVRPHTQEGRFSHRENLHLTLSFIGETGKVAQQVRQTLEQEGFKLEDRPFAAHLTLGREVLLEEEFELKTFSKNLPSVQMPVERVSLMKSERVNGRMVYTEVDFVVLNKNKP